MAAIYTGAFKRDAVRIALSNGRTRRHSSRFLDVSCQLWPAKAMIWLTPN